MADTTTTNYGLVKPEVGASNDSWGNKTNGNWDVLDAATKAVSNIANAAMPKAGGAFSGGITGTTLGLSGALTGAAAAFSGALTAQSLVAGSTSDVASRTIGAQNANTIVALAANIGAASGATLSYSFSAGGNGPLIIANSVGEVARFHGGGGLNVIGAITQNGSQVWHAANLDPTLKANLISPALTGTPTAPTAVSGTNTTQIATTAFVSTAVAALVASSPAALDTLNELATALGNDPNFATSVSTAIGLKAALAGAAFTGPVSFASTVTVNGTTKLVASVDPNSFLQLNDGVTGGVLVSAGSLRLTGQTVSATISNAGFNVAGAITQSGSQVWHAGNFTPGNYLAVGATAANSSQLGGVALGGSANNFALPGTAFVPHVKSDGVMEVGRYLDFHDVNNSDFSVRFDATATKLMISVGGTAVFSIDSSGTIRATGTFIGSTTP
jgi:hypothetical protein